MNMFAGKQLNDMQFTFTTVNWLLHLAAALCVVLYLSLAVNTMVAVLTLLAGVSLATAAARVI